MYFTTINLFFLKETMVVVDEVHGKARAVWILFSYVPTVLAILEYLTLKCALGGAPVKRGTSAALSPQLYSVSRKQWTESLLTLRTMATEEFLFFFFHF